ncbi:piggyBac transposable element-derived protein 3-like [Homalodisca vitripennis]|uniref:piggyBac transposable element-derived protein 3-like n=1 Tax=Homalodisca vitripennis TaxID=197043 RepID=UPI001EEA6FB9|nr:piggyBac transposable element-derived protein 3-like [Homalodisca vitripennis]
MWHPVLGYEVVKDCMGVNKFQALRSVIHFNDNSTAKEPTDPDRDRLFKIRPLIEYLNQRFLSVPMRPTLSVDEQICATKTRHHMRQYNPRKPHKWGYKLFVICDDNGYAYKFEIYCGQEPPKLQNEPQLGTTGNIVVRLAREVPRNLNYTIYCDNYYSSIPLFGYLNKEGILMLGTFRQDRLPDFPLPPKKEMRKTNRGSTEEYTTTENDSCISIVTWHDNDVVTIGSTFCGALPMETIQRYDRKEKQYIVIQCPKIVKIYNKHMGGVDLMDSHIGMHHIKIKSKK